jgi:phosphomannomutase
MEPSKKVIALFDVDATLTPARKPINQNMIDCLEKVKEAGVTVGVVSGSDHAKIINQIDAEFIDKMEHCFFENGCVYLQYGKISKTVSILDVLGEENLKKFINFCLRYISDLDIPIKRGTFVEFRTGLINVSPIGRNCSYEERAAFNEYDKEHNIRKDMIKALKNEFEDLNLTYSIGGQISFDVFPNGWDKRVCLQYLTEQYDEIHFFGDSTSPGGNDYEIYDDERTIGHSVKDPEDTIQQLKDLFLK